MHTISRQLVGISVARGRAELRRAKRIPAPAVGLRHTNAHATPADNDDVDYNRSSSNKNNNNNNNCNGNDNDDDDDESWLINTLGLVDSGASRVAAALIQARPLAGRIAGSQAPWPRPPKLAAGAQQPTSD